MLPAILQTGENAIRVLVECIEIRKAGGTVTMEASAPLQIGDIGRPRICNIIPGFETVPVFAEVPREGALICRIRVKV